MVKRLWEIGSGNLPKPALNIKMPDLDNLPAAHNNTTNSINGDVNINMEMNLPNVTNSKEFSTAVKRAFQNDESLRKCIQAGTIDLIAGKNKLEYMKY